MYASALQAVVMSVTDGVAENISQSVAIGWEVCKPILVENIPDIVVDPEFLVLI